MPFDDRSKSKTTTTSSLFASTLLTMVFEVVLRSLLVLVLASYSGAADTATNTNNRDDFSTWSPGKLRSAADERMASGQSDLAVQLLQQAIQLEPENPSNYLKLYKIHSRKRKYMDALDVIAQAATLDASLRATKAKLLVQLGQCDRAVEEYQQHYQHQQQADSTTDMNEDPDYQRALQCQYAIQSAHKAFLEKDYERAAQMFDAALQYVELVASDLIWPRAQSLYFIGDYYGCISETAKLLKQHSNHVEAYELRGSAFYRLGDLQQAVIHYREGLKLDPEHKECKAGHKLIKSIEKRLKKATDASDKRDFKAAVEHYQAALEIDPDNTMFVRPTMLLLAKAHSNAGQHDQAKAVIEQHLSEEESMEGIYALGQAQQDAEQWEIAVRTFQRAVEFAVDEAQKNEAKRRLQEAQVALKQSKEKNYYTILGVSRSATQKEIKKAYRDLALRWHPDKVSPEDKEKAGSKFQDIGEAYEVLSDDELRAKFDRGDQVFENQGGGGHHTDPFQFFHQNFQGGGQQQQGGQRVHFRFN
jgi:DnaJ family protein C protein 3